MASKSSSIGVIPAGFPQASSEQRAFSSKNDFPLLTSKQDRPVFVLPLSFIFCCLFYNQSNEGLHSSVTVFYMDKICLLRQSKSCLLDHLWQSLLLKSCNNHQARGSCNQKQGWSVSVREASEPQVRPCILFPWLCSSFPPYPWFLLSCNLHHNPKPSLPGTWGSNRDNCLVFPQVYVY